MDINNVRVNFEHTQLWLLLHKYWYYIENNPQINDQNYDSAENYSRELAKTLGFRANIELGPEDNEKHHIHWLIGFDDNSIYWENCKVQFKSLLPKTLFK